MSGRLLSLRVAVRRIIRDPGFTISTCVCLAFGSGGATAILRVLDIQLLRPPAAVREAGALRRIYVDQSQSDVAGASPATMSFPLLSDIQATNRAFSSVSGYWTTTLGMGLGVDARNVRAALVSGNYFHLLGVRAAQGALLSPAHDRPIGAAPMVVLSTRLWKSAFASDTQLIGRSVVVGNTRLTVIGVAEAKFDGIDTSPIDLWVPISMAEQIGWGERMLSYRSAAWINVLGRLKPGVNNQAADEDLQRVLRVAGESDPKEKTRVLHVGPLHLGLGPARGTLVSVSIWIAWVSAGLFIIACANVAALSISKATEQRSQIALKLALGASTTHAVSELLIQLTILAAIGVGLGIALYSAVVSWLTIATGSPAIGFGWREFAIASAAVVSAVVLSGLWPACFFARAVPKATIAEQLSRHGQAVTVMRDAMVVLQMGLCVALLSSAFLFVRTLRQASSVGIGLDIAHLLVADIDLQGSGMSAAERDVLYDDLKRRALELAPVKSASLVGAAPFMGSLTTFFDAPGGGEGSALLFPVDGEFFRTVGTALIRGRPFNDMDRSGAPPVGMINESFARRYWPSQDPLGQCMEYGGGPPGCTRVVGVVQDSKYTNIGDTAVAALFVPLTQRFAGAARGLVLNTAGSAKVSAAAIRRALQTARPELPYVRISAMSDSVESQLLPWRVGSVTAGVFGAAALFICAFGLYGALSLYIGQRRHEFAVRLALGCGRSRVQLTAIRVGMKLAALGALVGMSISLAVAPLLARRVVGMDTATAGPFILSVITLLVIAAGATIVPALRASQIDASATLRDS